MPAKTQIKKPQLPDISATLRAQIDENGPLSLSDYMEQVLTHYYSSADPLGARGDFITAPEISQMFGELIGAWLAHTWEQMKRPDIFHLIELGPGRGTLMADVLRATKGVAGFHDALNLHLAEISPVLRAAQARKLSDFNPQWHENLDGLPAGPTLFVANEFFDALPIRQFEKTDDSWAERVVTYDNDGFQFCLKPADIELPVKNVPAGTIAEMCEPACQIALQIAEHIKTHQGAALIIDYGYEGPAFGDTLQALGQHKSVSIFDAPGTVDLTAHVDFAALRYMAEQAGCKTSGPVEQGGFLTMLGIFHRAKVLEAQNPDVAQDVHRLIAPDQMGELFKVMAVTAPGLPQPEGFGK